MLAFVTASVLAGTNVYLFLAGMMLLAELARGQGVFDWLATHAARAARGSPTRLFALVYAVGTLVTVFLSNDATAVVLTPAVAAAARAARAEDPRPYLFVCAFVANAASFVLPISNPANLVLYGARLPTLAHWLALYAPAATASVVVTGLVLWLAQRRALRTRLLDQVEVATLSTGGRRAAVCLAGASLVLLGASFLDLGLGAPTLLVGVVAFLVVAPGWSMLKAISWGVLPLVAVLFVAVGALRRAGVLHVLAPLVAHSAPSRAWVLGALLALADNLFNNLPVGLLSGQVLHAVQAPPSLRAAALIGVDLGPNLSVTGSLATILWLVALRREGERIRVWHFLKIGCLVMPPALLAALALLLW